MNNVTQYEFPNNANQLQTWFFEIRFKWYYVIAYDINAKLNAIMNAIKCLFLEMRMVTNLVNQLKIVQNLWLKVRNSNLECTVHLYLRWTKISKVNITYISLSHSIMWTENSIYFKK